MIIGLSGYARAGKDEAAKALVHEGFTRVAFADKLREFLYRLNPIVNPRVREAFAAFASPAELKSVIDTYGWDGYKSSPYGDHIREYLQRLGTECGRELISDTIWIDAALGGACTCTELQRGTVCHDMRNEPHVVGCPRWGMKKSVVITDVRFPNEAQAIKTRGGQVWRINRPGVGPANSHSSETALDDYEFDHIIENDGTIEQFHANVSASAFILSRLRFDK